MAVTEHVCRTARHTSFYLAAGTQGATPIIFVHGWPELAISWRHQLPAMAALGFRAIAPDMRGYGRSSTYPTHADYALEHSVQDMLELLDHLGAEKGHLVGHDWGAPVVWSLASHHPDRCHAIANLCVPYYSKGFAPENFLPYADRTLYPEAEFPFAQWEYMAFYQENFARAHQGFEANVANTVKAMFRKGNPAAAGTPSRTALVRRGNGWFGPANTAPDVPRDPDVLTEADWHAYTAALTRTGFFGPDSWYMNFPANLAFAKHARNNGKLTLPVLFLHGAYDYTCETMTSRLAEPMRQDCADLTEIVVPSGHWMAQERPTNVNAALAKFLATKLPQPLVGSKTLLFVNKKKQKNFHSLINLKTRHPEQSQGPPRPSLLSPAEYVREKYPCPPVLSMQIFPVMPHPAAAPVEVDVLRPLAQAIAHAPIPAPLKLLLLALLAVVSLAAGFPCNQRRPLRDWYLSPTAKTAEDPDSALHPRALRAIRRRRAWIGWILRCHPAQGMAPSGMRALAPRPIRAARAPP